MTLRADLESIDLALASLKHDLDELQKGLDGRLKFRYTAAAIRHTMSRMDNAAAYLREAHSLVPVELDKDS